MSNSCFLFTPTVFTLVMKSSVLKEHTLSLGEGEERKFLKIFQGKDGTKNYI